MRAVGDGLLVDRAPDRRSERGGFLERVALHDLVPDDDRRHVGRKDPCRQICNNLSGGRDASVDARAAAEVDVGFGVQYVAGQGDEDRTGRGRRGDLGRAAHDAGQVLETRNFHCPLHEWFGHADEGPVEEGLHQAVSLLLLAGGQDHRRAGELRVEQRAHRVA